MTAQTAIRTLQEVEEDQYGPELLEAVFGTGSTRLTPSRALVHFCLNRWYQTRFRADNTTVLAVMIEDNQGVALPRNDQNLPMSSLFSDSEEEDDSDDGYCETIENNEYFSQNNNSFKNYSINSMNNENKDKIHNKNSIASEQISSATTSNYFYSLLVRKTKAIFPVLGLNSSVASHAEESQSSSASTSTSTELLDVIQNVDNNTIIADTPVFTPLTNVLPNFESNSETNPMLDSNANHFESIGSPLDESSRDSGTDSPPTPLAITACEDLTDDEYYSLPSVVNLSQNEWELFVVIDPKNLSVLSTDFNAVSISGEENACVEECQSSLANLTKVIEDQSLNNYIYGHRSGALRPQTNGSDFVLNYSSNYWTDSNSFYSLPSIRSRTSLPLSYTDNGMSSPLVDPKDRLQSPDPSLCIFGALQSNSMSNSITNDNNYLKKLSKVLTNGSNNELNTKSALSPRKTVTSEAKDHKRPRVVLRHSRLLKRISLDNKLSKASPLAQRLALKRKLSSSPSDYSPPAKHLRSSLWTRPLVTKEQVMRMSLTRSLKQLAVGRLTRSRLRPLKLLKSLSNNSSKK